MASNNEKIGPGSGGGVSPLLGLDDASYNLYKTKDPTGLAIARNGNAFTFSWVNGDVDYDGGLQVQYRVNSDDWKSIKLSSKKVTSASATISFNNYKPVKDTAFKKVSFRVKGQRKPFTKTNKKQTKTVNYSTEPTAWVPFTAKFAKPAAPNLSVSAQSSDIANQCTFSWSASSSASDFIANQRCEWESVLVPNCNFSDGKKATWNSSAAGYLSGTSEASGGSRTVVEDQSIAGGSYTRWFRVRARGIAGDSGWSYKNHVFARPYTPKNITVSKTATASGYTVTVKWDAPSDLAHPIDSILLQYLFAQPLAGMACPVSDQWQDATLAIKDTQTKGGASVDIPGQPTEDQALYIRVVSRHDDRQAASAGVLVAAGALSAPSDITVSLNGETHRANIEAQNNCDIPGSFLAITYSTPKKPTPFTIAIIPNGSTSISNVHCPADDTSTSVTFGVQAVVGSYTSKALSGGVSSYTVTKLAQSAIVYKGGEVPSAPANVTLSATSTPGTLKVSWSWSWSAATFAELSWSDHPEAWTSTDQPDTYEVDRTNAAEWYITGLETGTTWYVRVRLGKTTGNETTYGHYSETKDIKLASAPSVPVLFLPRGIISRSETVEASWTYVTNDGSAQASATVAEVITSGGTTTYSRIASALTQQHATINPRSAGWANGTTHNLAVRVTSGSGRMSDGWSDPVPLIIAEPLTATITTDSINANGELVEMPLTVTVTGAGTGGVTTFAIERAEPYFLERPDESVSDGYQDETIAAVTQTGEAPITINVADLIGSLDDGARYRFVATVQDGFGQMAEAEPIPFIVAWTEKAIVPEASVEVDNDEMAAFITPIAPTGASETATCDIYRLSVDKPVLIYRGATFGETYVDPFPTIGDTGGHRLVYRTETGSYITADNGFAWLDVDEMDDDIVETYSNIIDWEGGRVYLAHNIDISNDWKKDFEQTQYLGGSVQGDWNPAVERTGSIDGVLVVERQSDIYQSLHRLAVYAGVCHVRTKDGSSYAADVQVSEDVSLDTAHKLSEISLKITKVDAESLDGLTLEEWEEMHPSEEEP